MLDPITHYYEKFNFNPLLIKEFINGKRYVAVLFENGNIGVCATLGHLVEAQIPEEIDLKNTAHRIFLNAYFNALLNYGNEYLEEKDIFQAIDFRQFNNVVMIGHFRPVVKRFQEANIPLYIFDKNEDAAILKEMKYQMEYIQKADAIILTATSIYNQSFIELIQNSSKQSSIFILGPSAIMHPDMKNYPNVKKIFGSVYAPFDKLVLKAIKANLGTRSFSPFSKKVYN